jgi:hypothetical protein
MYFYSTVIAVRDVHRFRTKKREGLGATRDSHRPGRRNLKDTNPLKVHKVENFFDSDFGICIISLLVMSKY